jgi:hypothetical protein
MTTKGFVIGLNSLLIYLFVTGIPLKVTMRRHNIQIE